MKAANGSGGNRSVLYQSHDRVALITLNRPRLLNAIDAQMSAELRDCLDRARDSPAVAAVVITGAGRGFSAGADLSSVRKGDSAARILNEQYIPILERIRGMDKPVIAAVNGSAAGGGASLAIACDIVYAASGAYFCLTFIQIGLIPDLGATFLLPRRVGPGRALELALTGRVVRAAEALEIGLVDALFSDEEMLANTMAIARTIAAQPPLAVAATKDLMQQNGVKSLAEAVAAESEAQERLGRTSDFHEGVAAFLAKRPPVFKGR